MYGKMSRKTYGIILNAFCDWQIIILLFCQNENLSKPDKSHNPYSDNMQFVQTRFIMHLSVWLMKDSCNSSIIRPLRLQSYWKQGKLEQMRNIWRLNIINCSVYTASMECQNITDMIIQYNVRLKHSVYLLDLFSNQPNVYEEVCWAEREGEGGGGAG